MYPWRLTNLGVGICVLCVQVKPCNLPNCTTTLCNRAIVFIALNLCEPDYYLASSQVANFELREITKLPY